MKNRSEIEEKYTWDLTPLCKNDEEFYKKLQKINDYLPKLKAFEGKLNNKETIYEFLKLDEEFSKFVEPIALYAHLRSDEVLSDDSRQEMGEKLSHILNIFSIETSFASSELSKLSNAMLDDIIKDKKFENYNRMFEEIKRDKKHMLSKSEEKLLSGMNFLSGFSSNMELLADVDIKFGNIKDSKGKMHELNQSTYTNLVRSDDRKLRRLAMTKLNGTFGDYINMLANNYINDVKSNCYFAKVRKYKSALDSALLSEEIDKKVYDMLIKEVGKNLPVLFDYFKTKQKLLGLKTMYVYDHMANVGHTTTHKYTYDEAIEIIKKAVSPLGEEYVALIDRAKNERWIDVYPSKDKASGAYQTGVNGVHPYVLTNFEGDLDSIFTLAHELGHAMHSYYSDKTQVYQKSNYPIFLAEIASTTNEMLLINYLLSVAKSKEEKIALYNKLFDEVKGSIFRQTMFAEFEEKVHSLCEEGEPLTKDRLCETYYFLAMKYFGPVKLIKEIRYEWARIPHFFRAFYVYKYATGMISAITFTNRILSNDKDARSDYIKFLSAGCSEKPLKILQNSGCDLLDAKTFSSCFDYLKKMMAEWKALID